ncbi:MAG: nuclear transport factor 2 family protein [Lysobacteraceae bacterium]
MMLAIVLLAATAMAGESPAPPASPNAAAAPSLLETISALDAATFDAFNHCDQPGQLDRHAGFFSENVEFYHDTGGVTWNRADMLANTRKYVCGHFTRELVPGTLVVYPIKGFGAIEQGTHRFCQVDGGQCDGLADFTIVWHDTGTTWEITRVLSYGHRPAPAAP